MAVRISQAGIEAVLNGSPFARISQAGIDVVRNGAAACRFSQLGIELSFAPTITGGAEFVTATDKTNSTTLNGTTLLDVDTDQLAVIVLATDNEDTADGNTSLHQSVSIGGEPCIKAREFTNGQGSASAGATVSVWYLNPGTTITSGATVAATLNVGKDAKALVGRVFDLASSTLTIATDGVADLTDDGIDPSGMSAAGSLNVEHLWVRGIAVETANGTAGTMTPTDGWQNIPGAGTTGAAAASNMSVRGEFRFATGTASGTSDPTLVAADSASVLVGIAITAAPFTAAVGLTGGSSTLAATAAFDAAAAFTATAALSGGTSTLAGSATFAPGTHTASAALSGAPSTLAASSTFAPGTHTASAALSGPASTLAALATFTTPSYTAAAALSGSSATLAASVTFATPVYTATAGLTGASSALAASATFAPGTKTAAANLVGSMSAMVAAAIHTTPSYTAAADLVSLPSLLSAQIYSVAFAGQMLGTFALRATLTGRVRLQPTLAGQAQIDSTIRGRVRIDG